jgi:hypothetical protein
MRPYPTEFLVPSKEIAACMKTEVMNIIYYDIII